MDKVTIPNVIDFEVYKDMPYYEGSGNKTELEVTCEDAGEVSDGYQ